ncbi:hypothetical protein [Nocardia sp. NPDC048505]|uniref:hypothetical protein n=1 Tax=unclassified Nocardia TaxID=2637762 RepID=UPI0033C8C047
MSNSSALRKPAQLRAKYTEEPKWFAERAIRKVDRGGSSKAYDLGFDRCLAAQQRFRAIMSLFLLNTDEPPLDVDESPAHKLIRHKSISRLLCYTMTFSPQYDEFMILSDMPDHIIQSVRMPGLRRHCIGDKQDSLLLSHVPTGARVRFCRWETSHPSHRRDLRVYPLHFNDVPADTALVDEERAALEAVPEMHPDSERLLAGLVSRVWLSSKREGWAVSGLTWDALGRSFEPFETQPDFHFRYLWGSGTEWLLRWSGWGSVPTADVARALTHDHVGLEGARAVHDGPNRSVVRLGHARLVLECNLAADYEAKQGGRR